MKVFLSWSGQLSHSIAVIFRDWLPQVFNKVNPYVSSEDIDKGERWATDIAKELEASLFGIIFITPGNLNAPWINFEAGALSKTVDKANVVPFLFGLKRSEVVGPLLQFQSAIYEEPDIRKLLGTINRRLAAEDQRPELQLQTAFEVWYPRLRDQLEALKTEQKEPDTPDVAEQRKPTALLEEVLDIVRSQQKLLRNPELLLPRKYLEFVLRRDGRYREIGGMDPDLLHKEITSLQKTIRSTELPEGEKLAIAVNRLHDRFHECFHRDGLRSRRQSEEAIAEKEGL
ncbi:MAG TPA: hypothetical protein VNH18_10135 [Bryobacteraceae bacterium]|nr:hypothetical protein [Bryobacteraceae bacterium]